MTRTSLSRWSVAFLFLSFTVVAMAQKSPAYKNPSLPVEQRIKDLLGRMNIEEKAAQLSSTWQHGSQSQDEAASFVDKDGKFDEAKARVILKNGIGQVSRPGENRGPAEMAEFTNTVQKFVMENTRLGIPTLFHEECLHGHAAPKGTSYPQAIALASTWDTALLHEVFSATAQEVRARGAQQCLMPVLDLARDPRWGRTEETYGEDPYLAGRLGVAAVTGLQGDGPKLDSAHVYATLKHFAVHSQPEGGTNVGPADFGERTIRGIFLAPFEMAVKEAHARSIMPSYNELDGIPNHSNDWLLRNILRKEWGFDGTVVSDYFGIHELIAIHHISENCEQAARFALGAGVDIELPQVDCYRELPALVRSGKIPRSLLDEAVARVLRSKFEAGLFDHPYVDPKHAEELTNNSAHQALSLKAAHEAITLLKNNGGVLPLEIAKLKRIAVIGPNAADAHLGGYAGTPVRAVSILQGIRDKVGERAEVVYAEGCRITESAPAWGEDNAVPADAALDAERIAEAVKVLSTADIGIVVVGENEQTSREAWSATHMGDRDDLNLLGRQDELVRQLIATGKPVIVILLHGRPNSIEYIATHAPAILDGWYLGQEGGTAMAAVLFGDYNPAGRLPITVPRSVGQLPDFYYGKSSSKRGYLFSSKEPLFPFGFGLSYTKFKYENLHVEPKSVGPGRSVTVKVDVTNAGTRDGDEVVQLYTHQQLATVTVPVKQLRGFQRVHLRAGESRPVVFELRPEQLAIYNRHMKRVVEPGVFDVMVGPNSVDGTSTTFKITR